MARCLDCKFCKFSISGEQESFGGHAYVSSVSYDAECSKGYYKKFNTDTQKEVNCKGFGERG